LIAAGYQTALCFGLQTWILEAARVDVLTANKEGICSFLGYLSIFLFGLECGTVVFQDNISESKLSRMLHMTQAPAIKQTALQLCVYSGVSWALFQGWIYLSPDYYVSRRMVYSEFYFLFKYHQLIYLILPRPISPIYSGWLHSMVPC
jgi:phosphatidylinositol glycan class W